MLDIRFTTKYKDKADAMARILSASTGETLLRESYVNNDTDEVEHYEVSLAVKHGTESTVLLISLDGVDEDKLQVYPDGSVNCGIRDILHAHKGPYVGWPEEI